MSASAPELGASLDGLAWAHVTATRRALSFDFSVRVMDAALGVYLDRVLVHDVHQGAPRHQYSLVDEGSMGQAQVDDGSVNVDTSGAARLSLYFDAARLVAAQAPDAALNHLLWHINRQVVAHSDHVVLIHAAAVELQGIGVLLPAPAESGKTTLAAGLVMSGFRYLTDEAAAIDPLTLQLLPYPKALSVDPGSWGVLAELRPQVDATLEPYLGSQWHVPPEAIRPDAVAPPCAPRLVIAPRYEEGASTSLEPISGADGLGVLAGNAFNLGAHGARGLQVLAAVAGACRCYRLTVGDLDEACRLVTELVGSDERIEA